MVLLGPVQACMLPNDLNSLQVDQAHGQKAERHLARNLEAWYRRNVDKMTMLGGYPVALKQSFPSQSPII